MRKYILHTLCFLCLTLGMFGQSPQSFSYQAELRDDTGQLLADSEVSMRITIREGSDSGTIRYEEIHQTTTSNLGKLTLQVGNGDPQPTGDSFEEINWGINTFFIEVAIDESGGSNFETISNSQLLSVPYALYAAESGSTTSGGFELPFNGVFNSSSIPVFELSNVNGGNNVIAVNNEGSGDGNGVLITNNNDDGIALRLVNNGQTGLSITNNSSANSSAIFIDNNANENSINIMHDSGSQDALIIDVGNSSTGLAARFEGASVFMEENLEVEENLNIGQDIDVGGNIDVSEDIGVGGSVFVDDDINAGGILIVEGLANIGGNLIVQGDLSKAGGSFKIDHPLDPYNKYLYHSFVESPDMMNIYNGVTITDEEGYAQVQMQDWFTTLNMDFRYQLTLIGDFGQAIVKEKMNDLGSFTIQTNIPNAEVSWQVTGIRNDAWAQQNRIPTEENKTGDEKGQLLHPNVLIDN